MTAAILLRDDFDGPALRFLARQSRDPGQTRRLLALAGIYDGGSRSDVARTGVVGLVEGAITSRPLAFAVWTVIALHTTPGVPKHMHPIVALVTAGDRLGLVSKRREGAGGRLTGGQHFSRGALYLMLQNRIYRGEITHQGRWHRPWHADVHPHSV
jgi:hypothetical protein